MDDTASSVNPELERTISPAAQPEEERVDTALRPQQLTDFIGQDQLKKTLIIAIEAAKKRAEPLEHILLYGNPGLGKTTLSHIVGHEMNSQVRVTSGPALEKVGDLAAILSNLQTGDILFIDEIHRINRNIEEVLYPALEDFMLDIVIGKGPSARTMRLPLNRFTLIGATTKLSLLSAPLRDRFGHTYHLNFYETADIGKIIERNAIKLGTTLEKNAVGLIAERSRRTPRIANRLLKRLRDVAEIEGGGTLSVAIAEKGLDLLAIDAMGLDDIDRLLLRTLIEKFNGGPSGVNTLAAAIAEETDTIETVYEPYLLQIGFLERTPRGRKATPAAYRHLGFREPAEQTLD